MNFFSILIVALILSVTYTNASSNIVGGQPAIAQQLPFVVSLNVCGTNCGGFLITPTHVGTAANCFVNASATCITAQAGTVDVTNSTFGQLRNASSFQIHPNYSTSTHLFDAAIITLATPFSLDNTVRTVTLETNATNLPIINATVYVAGWGFTSNAGPNSSNNLNYVDLTFDDLATCNITYNLSLSNGNQVCAGGLNKDFCRGDNGGPLFTVANIADTIDAKVIGIASFGAQNCATAGISGVYADVPGFANAFFQSVISTSASVAASSALPSSNAPSSNAQSSVVVASSSGPIVAASSVVAAASSVVAAASSVVAAASSTGGVAASSVVAAASSVVAAASSTGGVAASSVVAAASSVVVAASSGVVAASSGVVAASSVVAAASSGAVAASSIPTPSQSSTPSQTLQLAVSSGFFAPSSQVPIASTGGAAASSVQASKVIAAKTKTGLAAVTCRQSCQKVFRSCKKTTRRIRTCKRAKKVCVAGCGVVNPNRA